MNMRLAPEVDSSYNHSNRLRLGQARCKTLQPQLYKDKYPRTLHYRSDFPVLKSSRGRNRVLSGNCFVFFSHLRSKSSRYVFQRTGFLTQASTSSYENSFSEENNKDRIQERSLPETWMMQANASTKYIATLLVVGAMVWHRDLNVCWCFIGSCGNSAFSLVLKRIFNIARPTTGMHEKLDPGMPSSHAQSLAYLATYPLATFLLTSSSSVTASGAPPVMLAPLISLSPLNAATSVLCILGAAALAWLRIACGFHTYAQVLVGFVFGTAASLCWRFFGLMVYPVIENSLVLKYGIYAMAATLVFLLAYASSKPERLTRKFHKVMDQK